LLAWGLALLLAGADAGAARPADVDLKTGLRETLTARRAAAGLEPLAEPESLRKLADRRAGEIAGAAAERRLLHPVAFEDALEDWPDLEGLRLAERVTVVAATSSGPARLQAAWDNPAAGALALDPASIAVGLGAWLSADGTLVLVAVFQSTHPADDRESLERALVDAINELRLAHSMHALEADERLRRVARAHSETMLAGEFLGHASPDGSMPADRVRQAKIGFQLVGENVARSLRPLGAAHGVVDEWMASPGHRANILTPDFHRTAVGAAIAADGAVYLTQLFLEP
jgi:uncharacterized protein YkwD